MRLFDDGRFAVERAVIADAIAHEGAEVVVDDGRAAVIRIGKWHKCVFADVRDFREYADRFDLYGNVCFLGVPEDRITLLDAEPEPCVTYAYLNAMPPVVDPPAGVEIKRLAPSLAATVLDAYHNPGGGYTVERIAAIMREKGIFGAISGGKLAGFIGRHSDGSMGMLEVFEPFRGRGIASALERFLITYVMTFGRTPFCDVYTDNRASENLQAKLGLTPAAGYTLWCEMQK